MIGWHSGLVRVDDWEIVEVSEETLAMLDSLAINGETYNDVITRLINLYESRRG